MTAPRVVSVDQFQRESKDGPFYNKLGDVSHYGWVLESHDHCVWYPTRREALANLRDILYADKMIGPDR